MKVRYREDMANYSDPESCGRRREAQTEALTGETAGQPLSREIINLRENRENGENRLLDQLREGDVLVAWKRRCPVVLFYLPPNGKA